MVQLVKDMQSMKQLKTTLELSAPTIALVSSHCSCVRGCVAVWTSFAQGLGRQILIEANWTLHTHVVADVFTSATSHCKMKAFSFDQSFAQLLQTQIFWLKSQFLKSINNVQHSAPSHTCITNVLINNVQHSAPSHTCITNVLINNGTITHALQMH